MKGKRFTEEQIIRVLKEAESGLQVSDLCRQQGISEATYYRWKSKLPVEVQVRRPGGLRGQAATSAGGRGPASEATGGR